VITTPLVNALDLIATFAFALVGARVAAAKGLDYGGIFLVAVLGGLLRDLFCQVEPVLLHRETIGTSCLAGALLYLTLQHFSFNSAICTISSGALVIAVRELSIYFDWDLPRLTHGK
jgi:uncharacterized membrane protein YeiH